MIIKYNRRSLCMGDDVDNGVYKIQMSDDATLGDLVFILLNGGNGNDWPIPQTSEIGWVIYSNIGRIADVSCDQKQIDYCTSDKTKLSELGIKWVFGERTNNTADASALARIFMF
ncbi:MAG: hypothetical protein IJG50_05990 [Clostridia bacterium]|nr:hypothetical protein [Clostridia bacterium]